MPMTVNVSLFLNMS